VLSVHGIYSEQVNALHSKKTSAKVKDKEVDVLKWADKLLTNSKNVKKSYKEKLGVDFDYILGPIDIKKFKNLSENIVKDENQIVYIGRDSFEKGIDVLKKIESEIDAKIIYCTDLEWKETMSVLKTSALIVVPSRIDNIPNVIKEAFFLRTPVIATDIDGISEIVTNDDNGVLVPPDNPEKLADAINQLLKDKEKRERLAKNGYEFVIKNLTWDILLSKYIKFYEDLFKE